VKRTSRRTGADRSLLDLDGIGPAMLADLRRLEVHDVATLARQDPQALYRRLCTLTGRPGAPAAHVVLTYPPSGVWARPPPC
jgi:hypothetical protein